MLRVSEGSVISHECAEMVQERGLVLKELGRRAGERDEICAVASRGSPNSSNITRQMSVHSLECVLRVRCAGCGRAPTAFGKCGEGSRPHLRPLLGRDLRAQHRARNGSLKLPSALNTNAEYGFTSGKSSTLATISLPASRIN